MKLTNTSTAAVLASGLLFAMTSINQAAADTDPDPSVVCWETGAGIIECEDKQDLRAECKLTDPGNTSDECKKANQRLAPKRQQKYSVRTKPARSRTKLRVRTKIRRRSNSYR